MKFCELNKIKKPDLTLTAQTSDEELGELFLCLVKSSMNAYLDYKAEDNVKRVLLRKNYLQKPKTRNEILAQRILSRLREGKSQHLMSTDSHVTIKKREADIYKAIKKMNLQIEKDQDLVKGENSIYSERDAHQRLSLQVDTQPTTHREQTSGFQLNLNSDFLLSKMSGQHESLFQSPRDS